jgi:hypothetical protein
MHPDDEDDVTSLGLQPQDDSGLPGPAIVLALLAGAAITILLAAYQAAQMVAWVYQLLTAQ